MTLADLPSRLGWLPCEECGQTGTLREYDVPFADALVVESRCSSCNGIGWLPSPAVLEAMAKAMRDSADHVGTTLLLSRILELAGMSMADVMRKDLGGFALMLENHVLNKDLARAAWEAQARHILERHEDL